jgi:hypothetical protein
MNKKENDKVVEQIKSLVKDLIKRNSF